jgi:hypothetical protein
VDQDDRFALAPLDVVQTQAIDIEELAYRRRLAFGSLGSLPIVQDSRAQCQRLE